VNGPDRADHPSCSDACGDPEEWPVATEVGAWDGAEFVWIIMRHKQRAGQVSKPTTGIRTTLRRHHEPSTGIESGGRRIHLQTEIADDAVVSSLAQRCKFGLLNITKAEQSPSDSGWLFLGKQL